MNEPRWINKLSVILLHAESLAMFGGTDGLRDEGLLESALARPRNLYEYRGITDLAALAAAYGLGIVQNHPFVDGNKRAAFSALGLFLQRNGHDLEADKADAARTFFTLAAGEMTEEELASWISRHLVKAE